MNPLEVMFVVAVTQSAGIAQGGMWILVLPFKSNICKILHFDYCLKMRAVFFFSPKGLVQNAVLGPIIIGTMKN